MITISQLLSGLIGSLLGVTVTLVIYLESRRASTKRAIEDRLLILRHDVWFTCADADVFKAWDASLKELWILFNAYYDYAPFWRRPRVRRAWEKYKGVNHYILDNLPNVPETKMFPKSKEEFIQNITSFLHAL
jgi:hypothetical protein